MTDTMTDDQFIAHYGVPGMKWGKRKADSGGSSRSERRAAKKAERAERDANIEKARQNLKDKSAELDRVAASTYSATTDKGRRRAEAMYDKLEREFFDGPDFATANQRTSGEQRADNILTAGLLGMAAVYIGVGVAVVGRR